MEKRQTLKNLYESGYEEDVIADQLDLTLDTVRTLIEEEIHPLKH
jgi:DNA-binding NarL/FixJ family response regulator